jgi:hypothetical protein
MPRFQFTSTSASSTVGYGQYFADWREGMPPVNISVQSIPTSSNLTYNIEYTLDYNTGSSTFTSSLANWFVSSLASAVSSATFFNITFPITALRLNVTAYSSSPTITTTVLQSG